MASTPGDDRKPLTNSGPDHFHDASDEIVYDTTPDSGVHETAYMDPEQRAKMEEEWRQELAATEEDIASLRMVLHSKVKQAQDLKRKLGITVWREFKDDMEQGIKNVKESQAYKGISGKASEWNSAITSAPLYHKTGTVIKTAGEKTTSVLGTLGTSVTKKIGDVKNSTTFKSFEERVGSAYENVKSKVSTSRSSSTQSFEEVLSNTSTGVKSSATTPTIHEDKPLA